jgi:integrase
MLQLPPSAKPAKKRQKDVSVSWRVDFVLRRCSMFNLQTLTAKARELRGNVVKATTTKGTRTMTPVYEREEQRKLRERIQQTQPDWVLLWWDIATVTGWRTSDVCNFRYSCINWETGIATIIVAKQTKAAEARATRKGIEIVRQQRKDAARLAGDHIAYMQWDSVSCDELAAGMTEEEQAIVFELVAKAEVKHDTKQLPPGIIKRLRERMERNLIGDDLVFSRSQIESNRCQSLEGSVSRQTIWKKLHNVMVWFTRVVNTRLRLSAYSSRKIAAFNLMSAGGEQGLLVASEMLGHSNPAITRTYLQLGSKASAIQSRLAMEVSV